MPNYVLKKESHTNYGVLSMPYDAHSVFSNFRRSQVATFGQILEEEGKAGSGHSLIWSNDLVNAKLEIACSFL